MLSEKLKENTKNNHQLLEKKLIVRIKSIRNKQDYSELLTVFYSFFGGLEVAIDACLDLLYLPDYPQRRKTAAIAEDLIKLGAVLPVLASTDTLPVIHDNFQALGALYVIEGSTLGGKGISKMISQQLNLTDLSALSFFNGYGDHTERMWQDFKQSIERPLNSLEGDIIIQSANDTFIKFSHWVDFTGN